MNIHIDLDRCMGHGQCEIFAPGIFRVGDEDVVEQLREVGSADLDAVRTAVQNCPERVLSLDKDDQ